MNLNDLGCDSVRVGVLVEAIISRYDVWVDLRLDESLHIGQQRHRHEEHEETGIETMPESYSRRWEDILLNLCMFVCMFERMLRQGLTRDEVSRVEGLICAVVRVSL